MHTPASAFAYFSLRLVTVAVLLFNATGWQPAAASLAQPAVPNEGAPTETPTPANNAPIPMMTETPPVLVSDPLLPAPAPMTPPPAETPTESFPAPITPISATLTPTAGPALGSAQDQTETIVTANAGGDLKTTDGRLHVHLPPNAVRENTVVSYRSYQPPLVPRQPLALLRVFELSAHPTARVAPTETFSRPVTLSLDITDQVQFPLPAGQGLWFGYLDPASQDWTPVEFQVGQNPSGRVVITAATTHFSTWGFGRTLDAGWLPLFNEPQVALFSGAATFNYPLEMPAGQGGIQPNLAVSFNSRQQDGVLAWTQGGWVGHGFDLDLPAITRDFTDAAATGDFAPGTLPFGAYAACQGRLRLHFNGAGYLLVPGERTTLGFRYYTQEWSQLYIGVTRATDTRTGASASYVLCSLSDNCLM